MSAVFAATLLTLCLTVSVNEQTRTLALFTRAGVGLDSLAVRSTEQELQRLLLPARIRIVWKTRQDPAERFEQIIVGSFSGNCSVAQLPLLQRSHQTSILGETSIQSGVIIPFFTVDCDRLIQSLRLTLDHLNVPLRQTLLGRAMGRIMAHEIYHIISQTTRHGDSGVTKASFSIEDLIAEHFAFDSSSLVRISEPTSIASDKGVRSDTH